MLADYCQYLLQFTLVFTTYIASMCCQEVILCVYILLCKVVYAYGNIVWELTHQH